MTLKVTVPEESYFAFGFGKTMFDTSMIFLSGKKDAPYSNALWSTGHHKPDVDTEWFESSNVKWTNSTGGVNYNFTVTRSLVTGNPRNHDIILD